MSIALHATNGMRDIILVFRVKFNHCIMHTLPLIVMTAGNAVKNSHTIQRVRLGIHISGPPETSRWVNLKAL